MLTTELIHFDTAARELALASSIDEVKTIRDQAEAIRQYIRQQKGSLEMQNQAAEIKIRAERRAGEMLKEADKNKGAATPLHDERAFDIPKLADLGISEIQSHRCQTEASVPEVIFERHIAEVKASGEELTSIGLYNLAKHDNIIATKWTVDQEWYTPAIYIEAARTVMGSIDCDPASNDAAQQVVKARVYYSPKNDGLKQTWHGNIFLNPPYSHPDVAYFVDKLLDELKDGQQAILLTNNNTDTNFFHKAARRATAICFTKGRISFYKDDDTLSSPTNGQAFFYFGDNREKFIEVFSEFGILMSAI